MFRRTALLPLFAALLLPAAACWQKSDVVAGKKFPYERAAVIKKHTFTTIDVLELLGEPLEKKRLDGRMVQWRYYCRFQNADRVLLFFDTNVTVTEQEAIVTFDGTLVEDVTYKTTSYDL